MNPELRPKIILVLGMHRSGTSLITQLIAKWGAFMGDDLMPADNYNQDGYWEYNPLVNFHEKLLEKTNNKWFAPSEEINTKELLIEFGDEARQLVEQMDKGGEVWCWKDPRMPLFLGFWKEVLVGRQIVYFVSNRNPEDIVASLLVRDKMPALIALSLWEFSNCSIFQALSSLKSYKFVDYNKIISEPELYCRELFNYLNKSFQLPEKIETCKAMVQSVKKSLNHAKPSVLFSLIPNHEKLQRIIEQELIPANFEMPEDKIWFLREIFSLYRIESSKNQNWNFAQLFYKNESSDCKEDQSLITEITGSPKRLFFKFDNSVEVKQLRFDPLNNYVKVHIHSIQILNQGKILDVPPVFSSNALSNNSQVYLFDTIDPQIIIDFPNENIVELDEVIVELEYVQKGVDTFPEVLLIKNELIKNQVDEVERMKELNDSNKEIHEQQKKLVSVLQDESETLKKELVNINELLQNYEGQEEHLSLLQTETDNKNERLQKQESQIAVLMEKNKELNQYALQNDNIIREQKEIHSSLQITLDQKINQINGLQHDLDQQQSELLNIKRSYSFKLSKILAIPMMILRPYKLIRVIIGKLFLLKNTRLIKKSSLFNKEYYLDNNPDVKRSGISAEIHFLIFGGFEGRKPSELFDSAFYLEKYPDVKASGMNPLVHYIKFGIREGRLPQQNISNGNHSDEKKYSNRQPIFIGKIKYFKNIYHTAIRRNGGVKIAFKKATNVLLKEGVRGVILQFKKQAYYSNIAEKTINISTSIIESNPGTYLPESLTQHNGVNNGRFLSKSTILFIGHDALLAGAQILQLSLISWFSEHTGLGIKIILLRGGGLQNKFAQIAPVLVWEELCQQIPNPKNRNKYLSDYIGSIDLIYGNTVLAPGIYDELKFLNVPFITHVHELEKSIKMYIENGTIDKMKLFTNGYIGCSKPVSLNLITNHAVDVNSIATINAFIEDKHLEFAFSKKELRKKTGLAEDGFIAICCGTMYWRKGVDLFIETAILLKKKGLTNFHFYWIGENFWDLDNVSTKICSWKELLNKIDKNGLKDKITFLGVKDNVYDYYQASDVFYLPSREDPFPLVCLEAAQSKIPVICFEDAGGMPDFVEQDAGFVVPFEDVDAVAKKMIYLNKNPNISRELGITARYKFLSRHSIEIAAPEILDYCRKIGNLSPTVSVILPNYNYGKYLKKRLDSILNQTFKDFEIIILDDASTDNSMEIINTYLHLPNVRLCKNTTNSGNTFKQWHKGFLEAKGEIIWFAEADDYCEPDFLHKLLPNFNNPLIALAYCDSLIIDESGKITGDYRTYLEQLDSYHWKSSYQVSGQREINYGLGVKNSIPNASAMLIRKDAISGEFFNEATKFQFSGDWFFYTQVIKGNHIAYCSDQLNYHRKHNQTITSLYNESKSETLLKEAALIHEYILANYSINDKYRKKWEFYLTEQIQAFYPNVLKKEFDNYYPYSLISEKITVNNKKSNHKRFVFITTNDGSSNGGSEQLWRQAAIECKKRGFEVMVVIKEWVPEPFFIEDFYKIGITVVFKEPNHFNRVKDFNPDLVVISIGDQDEGIDYYESCGLNKIPYVIVNHLTKEPKYWPIRNDILENVKAGYHGAKSALFTGLNNHKLMEKRLSCTIPNAGIFYNPFDVDIDTNIPFPSMENGLKIAIVGSLLRIHKGQHLAIEILNMEKWRHRPIQLNIYGKGDDEAILKKQVKNYKLTNITFHGHTNDILDVWKKNHAILLTSFMEGLPLVLVGAMISARVPILTDIGAHREVVEDNITGFIAKEPTVEAIDEALERAYEKSDHWEEIGEKAREKILSILPEDPIDDFISKLVLTINIGQ